MKPTITLGTLTLLASTLFAGVTADEIRWWTIDCGGGTSTNGTLTISGTIGQPDASNVMTGGNLKLVGGFWGAFTVVHCGAGDVGRVGGQVGADGVLDNNDFVAFINLFFASDPRADVGIVGGAPGHDNAWDNNDFVAFINLFFGGC